MIPESLTVLELQGYRNELRDNIEKLLQEFVCKTGVIVHIDPAHAGPRFDDGTVEVKVAVYCGLSCGLEQIPPADRKLLTG